MTLLAGSQVSDRFPLDYLFCLSFYCPQLLITFVTVRSSCVILLGLYVQTTASEKHLPYQALKKSPCNMPLETGPSSHTIDSKSDKIQ